MIGGASGLLQLLRPLAESGFPGYDDFLGLLEIVNLSFKRGAAPLDPLGPQFTRFLAIQGTEPCRPEVVVAVLQVLRKDLESTSGCARIEHLESGSDVMYSNNV